MGRPASRGLPPRTTGVVHGAGAPVPGARCAWPCLPTTSACCGWPSRPPPSPPRSWSATTASRRSLEAAWKYVVLASVGVAIAFLGIVLLYAATVVRRGADPVLVAARDRGSPLDPGLTRLAVALAVLGFADQGGTGADAQLAAGRPLPGAGAGVRADVGGAALRRASTRSCASRPSRHRCIGAGLDARHARRRRAAVAGRRRRADPRAADYKRMLAYSSIEHMGIMALGAAAGGVLAAERRVLLHVLGHGLVKASTFVVAGRILASRGNQLDHRESVVSSPDARTSRPPSWSGWRPARTAAVQPVLLRGGHRDRRCADAG